MKYNLVRIPLHPLRTRDVPGTRSIFVFSVLHQFVPSARSFNGRTQFVRLGDVLSKNNYFLPFTSDGTGTEVEILVLVEAVVEM